MENRWTFCRRSWTDQETGSSDCTRNNPARGFYHVYTYDLTEKEVEEDWVWSLHQGERLALVLLDIGKCANRALTDEELAKAARIFLFFQMHQMQMIVRVAYDREGHGLEREPRTIGLVCTHIRQLAPLLVQFSAHILTVQGLFIGSWGEMHGSHFLDAGQLIKLYGTLREATMNTVCISVRKPQFQRLLADVDGSVPTGLYDDAILGSDTDMGTFGWIDDCQNPQMMWTPRHELAFISQQAARTPVGGEVLSGALAFPCEEVLGRMRLMQLTYLNRVHEPAVWERWSAMPCDASREGGRMFSDCLGDYLGYRYVLSDVELVRESAQGMRMAVTIRNTGLACCYDMLRMELIVGKKRLQALFDGRTLAAGCERCISYSMEEALCGQDSSALLPVTLALYHVKTGLPVYFANDFMDARRWERYRSSSSLSEGIVVGVLSTEKEATS